MITGLELIIFVVWFGLGMVVFNVTSVLGVLGLMIGSFVLTMVTLTVILYFTKLGDN